MLAVVNHGAFAERVSHPRYEVPRVYHAKVHRAAELRPGTLLELLEATDAFRRVERFERLLLAATVGMDALQAR